MASSKPQRRPAEPSGVPRPVGARPQPIGSLLPGILKHVGEWHGVLCQVQDGWARLVGRRLAAHTKPVSLRRGRLIVHAERPGDNYTLSYQREQLLAQLQALTDHKVEEMVIRPGSIEHPRAAPSGTRRDAVRH